MCEFLLPFTLAPLPRLHNTKRADPFATPSQAYSRASVEHRLPRMYPARAGAGLIVALRRHIMSACERAYGPALPSVACGANSDEGVDERSGLHVSEASSEFLGVTGVGNVPCMVTGREILGSRRLLCFALSHSTPAIIRLVMSSLPR